MDSFRKMKEYLRGGGGGDPPSSDEDDNPNNPPANRPSARRPFDPYDDPMSMRHRRPPPVRDPYDDNRRRNRGGTTEDVGEDGHKFCMADPYSWKPPPMVFSNEEDEPKPSKSSSATTDVGVFECDAILYHLKDNTSSGASVDHSVLRMPTSSPAGNGPSMNTFNILMADVSGSMSSFWRPVKDNWNNYVAPNLVGHTRLFTFDSQVRYRRYGTNLEQSDFSSGGTELTGALQTIVSEVYSAPQKNINVFIITDGDHNGCSISPQTVIDKMEAPGSKVCNVFLLGAGNNFPVQYSIDIRSHLHNGSANLPSLYWAKQTQDMEEQMQEIGKRLSGGGSLAMTLNVAGSSLPGLNPKNTFHLSELVYFPNHPENYQEIIANFTGGSARIRPQPQPLTIDTLFEIFRMFNAVIIQLKYKKEPIPEGVIPFMERLFETFTKKPERVGPKTLSERMEKKDDKREEMDFRTLINGIKSILTHEKFDNQIELAEKILSTAVTRTKYEEKTLQLKGHTDSEYEADFDKFLKVYNEHKADILKLKVAPEHCCQATQQSTILDLQDEFVPALRNKTKFDFLKSFTISGIPVFAPTRDSVTLNPWSYSVQRILKAPYAIMSQVAMEDMAARSKPTLDSKNKEVQAKKDDASTSFNAIVPVFPPSASKTMQPIVRTRLYALCATFATLKNPHMIDFNVHMAALGVTWVRLLFDHPTVPRPEYVTLQMESIEATAACYMDRPGFANYARILLENPSQALMTESTITIENKPIKCESIVKPMFILRMLQHSEQKVETKQLIRILRTMLLEYIGRCLSSYKAGDNESMPYTDFFAESLEDQEKKKQIVDKFISDSKAEMSQSDSGILESFYTLEKARKASQVIAKDKMETMKASLSAQIPAKVSMVKVMALRNVSSAGDVSLATLETFARAIGLDERAVRELFSEESMFVYVAHALKHRSSKDRMTETVQEYDVIKPIVDKDIQTENLKVVSKDLYGSLVSALENVWLQEYLAVHIEIVEPMTRQQIVNQAQQRGIQVTMETFDQVYKRYREKVGLLGNACQTKACPHYLKPDKTFNQHTSVERLRGKTSFLHGLHEAAYETRSAPLKLTIDDIASGKHRKLPVPKTIKAKKDTKKDDKKDDKKDAKKPINRKDVSRHESEIKKLKNIYIEKEQAQSQTP